MRALAGRRVLVTGGTGFIGGRVVEKLVLEHGARVRVLASSYARTARVARFDVDLVLGDVADQAIVRRAAEGCDVIVHCAYGSRGPDREKRRVTVEGTRAVLDAAIAHGIRCVVHVSTMVVYGIGIEGRLDETEPRRATGIAYADTKREAEELVLRYSGEHGAPVTVIQPTAVYGPYAPSWTERVIASLKTGRVILVDGGTGLSNPVYVDDVADAILLAAVRDEALGQAFLIASGERVTWREFYGRFEAMLGISATVDMSRDDAKAHYARSRRRRLLLAELWALVREDGATRERLLRTRELDLLLQLLRPLAARPAMRPLVAGLKRRLTSTGRSTTSAPDAPASLPKRIQPTHPKQVDFLAAKTDVSIEKARRLLGYEPAFSLDRGMALTEAYLRWAGMLPDTDDANTACA